MIERGNSALKIEALKRVGRRRPQETRHLQIRDKKKKGGEMEAARRQSPFYLEAHEEIRYAEERLGMDVMCLWCLLCWYAGGKQPSGLKASAVIRLSGHLVIIRWMYALNRKYFTNTHQRRLKDCVSMQKKSIIGNISFSAHYSVSLSPQFQTKGITNDTGASVSA